MKINSTKLQFLKVLHVFDFNYVYSIMGNLWCAERCINRNDARLT